MIVESENIFNPVIKICEIRCKFPYVVSLENIHNKGVKGLEIITIFLCTRMTHHQLYHHHHFNYLHNQLPAHNMFASCFAYTHKILLDKEEIHIRFFILKSD